LGATALDDLVPIEGGVDWARVTGFVSRADGRGAARPTVRLFVNGRAVRDRALTKALSEGYRAAGAGECRGQAFLLVEAPRHLVDVNVHPAKTEVRFADPRTVWVAVERAVAGGLSAGARASAPRANVARIDVAGERVSAQGRGPTRRSRPRRPSCARAPPRRCRPTSSDSTGTPTSW
jgi:DNA mismatch repair protein MutL